MKEEEEGQKEYEEKEYRGRIKNMKQKKKKERKNRAGEEKKSFNIKGTITKPSPHFTAHLKLGKVGNQGTKACLLHRGGGKKEPSFQGPKDCPFPAGDLSSSSYFVVTSHSTQRSNFH